MFDIVRCTTYSIQLAQASVNFRLVLEVGWDFNFKGSHAWKIEVPPLQSSKWPDPAV